MNCCDTASECFAAGVDICIEKGMHNVRIVKQESFRSFGNLDLWSACQVFCDEFAQMDSDSNMVSINAKLMIDDESVESFVQCALKYDESLADIAKEVAVKAQECARLGIDFIEVR
jgi:SPX domain protein involved in polyphosphate accumulation